MNSYRDTLLHDILSQPTAPFREGHVIRRIIQELKTANVPYFQDAVGNLILGAKSPFEYRKLIQKKTSEPLRVFIAHMDHPGFHGVRWISQSELEVKWHGGSPTDHLEGAKVWTADSLGWLGDGQLKKVKLHPSGRAIESAVVTFSREFLPERKEKLSSPPHAVRIYGGFAFRAPYWNEGKLIYTKAADDLVGTFAIVSLALDYWKNPKSNRNPPFIGLLTRAEEVGFIGAIGHFEQGWLSRAKQRVLCISLETSRTLPGAEIGKGPVVRLGDRFTVFDAGALRIFSDLAQKVLPESHQRRIMDGGTCEASAATVYGFKSIGISIPLGNYHNQSFEGGPDAAPANGPAPEFVHKEDIQGLIQLCHALIAPDLPWASPWQSRIQDFKKSFRDYHSLLQSGC